MFCVGSRDGDALGFVGAVRLMLLEASETGELVTDLNYTISVGA